MISKKKQKKDVKTLKTRSNKKEIATRKKKLKLKAHPKAVASLAKIRKRKFKDLKKRSNKWSKAYKI